MKTKSIATLALVPLSAVGVSATNHNFNKHQKKLAVLSQLGVLVLLLFMAGTAHAQETPRVELFGGYNYLDGYAQSTNVSVPLGFASDIAVNVNHWFGVEGDISYNAKSVSGVTVGVLTFAGGPRFSMRGNKTEFYVHALIGDTQVGAGFGYGISGSVNALSYGGGVGLNIKVANHVMIRAFEVDYLNARFNNLIGSSVNLLKANTGVVFTF